MLPELNIFTGDEPTSPIMYILIGLAVLGILGLTVFPKIFNKGKSNGNGSGTVPEGNHKADAEENNKG